MRAPCDFKYSPHGYDIKIVHEGDEMTPYEESLAIDLGLAVASPEDQPAASNDAQPGVEPAPSIREKVARLFGAKATHPPSNKADRPALNKGAP